MPETILFRVDGGCVKDTGTGHIFRSLLLAGALRERHALTFASLDRPEYAYGHAQIASHGHPLHLLPPGQYHEAMRALLSAEQPAFIIADLYEYEEAELQVLKSTDAPLMTFDHFAAHRRYADYPINAVVPRRENRFDGPDYVVVPPPRVRSFREAPERIFICFGGFDYCDLPRTVASLLASLRIPQQVDIVVTGLYPRLKQLEDVARHASTTLTVHVQPDNFDDLLNDCDVAFVAGGLTMCQAMSVGASVVVLTQYEHQRRMVEDFAASGALIDLGAGAHVTDRGVQEILTGLLGDAAQRRSLGRQARTLVDGRGLERVVRLVTDALAG